MINYTEDEDLIIEVSAGLEDKDWGVIQSHFMRDNSKTTGFS